MAVEVSDDGPGVPADQLPRIFDRFYRAGAPSRRPGSGLGLAIVAAVAAAHDGHVTAGRASRTGCGSPSSCPRAVRMPPGPGMTLMGRSMRRQLRIRPHPPGRDGSPELTRTFPRNGHVIQALAAKEILSPTAR